jgi:hypothetical protein
MFNAFLDTYLKIFFSSFPKKNNTNYPKKEWLDYIRDKNILQKQAGAICRKQK